MKDAPEADPIIVDVAVPCRAWHRRVPGIARMARDTVSAVLCDAGIGAGEVSLLLSDDATVRALNARWRGKDRPTNVLSFAAGESRRPGLPRLLGDVVLAYETVSGEAAAQRKPFAHHVRHLIVHGVLHLLGHDHERARDAARMESRERRILKGFGIPDPYAPPEGGKWAGRG